jgi:hypothetical protein
MMPRRKSAYRIATENARRKLGFFFTQKSVKKDPLPKKRLTEEQHLEIVCNIKK